MKSPETVADIVYQSFRHSQGKTLNQALILEYAIAKTDLPIAYALQPDNAEALLDIPKYVRFLSGAPSSHGDVSFMVPEGDGDGDGDGGSSAIRQIVLISLEEVRKEMDRDKVGDVLSSVSFLHSLGGIISTTETVKLEETLPYVRMYGFKKLSDRAFIYEPDPEVNAKIARMLHRVQQGRPSFLLHHGKHGNTTGSLFFDKFYKDMWSVISANYENKIDPFDEHRLIVGKIAECVILQETTLVK